MDKNHYPHSRIGNNIYIINKHFDLFKNSLTNDRLSTTKGWHYVKQKIFPFKGDFAMGYSKEIGIMLLTYDFDSRKANLYYLDTEESFPFDLSAHNIKKNSSVFSLQALGNVGKEFIITDGVHQASIFGATKSENPSVLEGDVLNKYISKKTKFQEELSHFNWTSNVLKHLRSVGISHEGKLLINKHELTISNHLSLKNVTKKRAAIEATEIRDNVFQFPDGSSVTLHRSGMLILKPRTSRSHIFIPSVLEKSIGALCGNYFCGNTYFLKHNQQRIIIKSIGQDRNKAMKLINDIAVHVSNFNTAESMYDRLKNNSSSTILSKYFHLRGEMDMAENRLIDNKMEYEIELLDFGNSGTENEIITTSVFNDRFITPFLKDILIYEA